MDQSTDVIDTANKQLVSMVDSMIVVMLPNMRMTAEDALLQAAWLVALAERERGEFDKVLVAVKNS